MLYIFSALEPEFSLKRSALGHFETKSAKLFQSRGRKCSKPKVWAQSAFIAGFTFAVTGCMSSGTQVSDEQIDQFVKGKTTESEVIARLGEPDTRERSSNGERMDIYAYSKFSPKAQSFIPIIGGFIARSDTKSKFVRFTFSKAGVLIDWESSGSEATMNNGFLNQH